MAGAAAVEQDPPGGVVDTITHPNCENKIHLISDSNTSCIYSRNHTVHAYQ